MLFLSFIFLVPTSAQSQFCYPNGNVVIYSNYDGGVLNINVDQNIPNLRIGIVTYEATTINITGTFVGNVDSVMYVGYDANNNHCTNSPATTTVTGVPAGIVKLYKNNPFQTSTLSNPNGYGFIICNYKCDSAGNNGGCNSADQIAHYFITQFGGSLYFHFTQYGCWANLGYTISSGGNCCQGASIIPPPPPADSIVADFLMSADTICAGDTVCFTNSTINTYPGLPVFDWSFGDGSPNSPLTDTCHVYSSANTYVVTLKATESAGTDSDSVSYSLVVMPCIPDTVNASITSVFDTICAGDTICFTENSSSSTGGLMYNWDFGDSSAMDSNQSPCHSYSLPGSYTIVLTVSDSDQTIFDSDTLNIIIDDCIVGTDDPWNWNPVVFPNPGSGEICITGPGNRTYQAKLLDLAGKTIREEFFFTSGCMYHSAERGYYLLKITTEGGTWHRKILIR